MIAKDWKDRLVAEIEQCDIRLFQLEQHMQKIGKDSPEHSLLEAQMKAMTEYLRTLTARAGSFQIEYKLPSLQERMKSHCCCQANDDFRSLSDAFWLATMLYLATSGGESKW
jgi:hypothetical protein